MIYPHSPILIVISPLAGALILQIISRFEPPRILNDAIAFLSLLTPLSLLFYFAPLILKEPVIYELGGWPKPYGISLVLDSLSSTFAILTGIVTVIAFIYSLEARSLLPSGKKYYSLYLFMTTGLYGVFLSGDLINRYIFFELTILCTYVLLTYTGKKESLKASYYYLIIGSIASFMFLIAIGLTYFYTGYLDFEALGGLITSIPPSVRNIIFAFFLVAVGIKMGIIPFHTWLPEAHVSAPNPMTAVLAGVTVKTGVFILIRLFSIGFDTVVIRGIVISLGIITALLGVVMTFRFFDLKRILAWHTISQMGIITLCLAIWTPLSVAAGIMYIINHTLFKTLLFLSVGGFAYLHGTRDIRKLPLMESNLLLTSAFLIGVLAIIGVPPLNGFYSKAFILTSLMDYPMVYSLFIITHFLIVASFARIFFYSPFKKVSEKHVPESILVPIVVLSGMCVFIGATSTIWMNNVYIPASAGIVSQGPIESITHVEWQTPITIHGIILIGVIPISLIFTRHLNRFEKIWSDGILSRVSIADSIRYIILILAAVLLFTLF